jgi:gliding motility-associated-like protein
MKKFFNIVILLSALAFSSSSFGQIGFITSTSNDTVCEGSSGSMQMNGAVGSIVTWQLSTDGGVIWLPTGNATATQSFFNVNNNVCYRVIHNGGAAISSVYCITVDAKSEAGTIIGGGEQCGVANGTMVVTGNNGTTVGWYASTGGAFGSLFNTTLSQSFTNVTQTTYYAFLTKNGLCPADTAIDTISIVPYTAVGTAVSTASVVCASGNIGAVTINNSSIVGTNLGWQTSTDGTNWSNTSNTTNTIAFTNLTQTTYYQLIVKSGVCPADTSNIIQVNVDQAPIGGSLSGGTYYCGAAPATGTLTLSGESGTIVKWESNDGSGWVTSPCTGNTCNYSVSSNTLYRVEIDNGVCSSVYSTYDTVFISANSVAGTLSLTEDTLCAKIGGGLLSLTGSVGTNYNWQYSTNNGTTWNNLPSFTGPTAAYNNLNTGTYIFQCNVKNNLCTTVTSNTVSVFVKPSPSVTISTNDTTIEQGTTITLVASGAGTPIWTPTTGLGSPTSFTTTATPLLPTEYIIIVTDGTGCIGKDTVFVDMALEPFTGFIANALTPNEDGINDALYVENIEIFTENDIKIFNEYGQEVYKAAPYKNDWKGTYNGSRLPDGTYYYVLNVTVTNASLVKTKKEYKGFVSLLNGK